MNEAVKPLGKKEIGMIESALKKLFTRNVSVLDVVEIGSAFRIITLGGDALRNVAWTPGDKIQIQLGGWVQRTYTPMDWDVINGRMRILVYLHADAPGTRWARLLRKGDNFVVFGPRKSINLTQLRSPVIFFGDETSLGLAAALSDQGSSLAVHLIFEVSALNDTMLAIKQLQLDDAYICARVEGDVHFNEIETHMSAILMKEAVADIVLTGKASSIQRVTKLLRQPGVGVGGRHSKAYWATGKTGLD